jgi:hypothetical protein
MNELSKFLRYNKILDEVFDKPPRNVGSIVENIMSKYPIELFEINNKSYILLVKIAPGFYGISWVVTKEKDRNQGHASKLLNEIHNKYKGLFIAKTNSARGFYIKKGYKEVYTDERDTILVFVNDKGSVNF